MVTATLHLITKKDAIIYKGWEDQSCLQRTLANHTAVRKDNGDAHAPHGNGLKFTKGSGVSTCVTVGSMFPLYLKHHGEINVQKCLDLCACVNIRLR